jgi:hypothetical protein
VTDHLGLSLLRQQRDEMVARHRQRVDDELLRLEHQLEHQQLQQRLAHDLARVLGADPPTLGTARRRCAYCGLEAGARQRRCDDGCGAPLGGGR